MTPEEGDRPHVVVIGGGITGLAAAWELSTHGGVHVTVIETDHQLGGKIASARIAGIRVDTGPDSFLARGVAAVSLAEELGVALAPPRASSAFVWTRGKLRPLPDGLVLGFPSRLWPVIRSGIVSLPGMARAGLDLVLPSTRMDDDPSVAEAVTARFGQEVTDRLVEPLLGGIHAGTAANLSLTEVAPQVAGILKGHRSALRGIGTFPVPPRNGRRPAVFLTATGGTHRLVEALSERLRLGGVELRTGVAVSHLSYRDGKISISLGGATDATVDYQDGGGERGTSRGDWDQGKPLLADCVVVATPAASAGKLLAPLHRELASELSGIRYASVAVVTLAYPYLTVPPSLPGTGFLSPRCDGRLMTATTWLSAKWQHYADADACLVRVSVGRIDDGRFEMMDDAELARSVHDELRQAMGTIGVQIGPNPLEHRVTRWHSALPQYEVGHAKRVAKIEATAATVPGAFLCGAYLRGVGIPACIESGRAAARKCIDELARPGHEPEPAK